MDVNNIVCCGFNKAYSVLNSSKKGCLKESELYGAALFSYQVSILENHVSTEYSCLPESTFDTFSQKMQSCCGCCGVTSEEDTTEFLYLNLCPVCANAAHFINEPENDGIYVDVDSTILLTYSNGTFSQYFEKIGDQFTPYLIINGSNVRNGVYIDNPASLYHGKVAISRTDPTAPYESYIEIWDAVDAPVSPVFVTSFIVGNTVPTGGPVIGKIEYDPIEDAIYFMRPGITNLYKLNLTNGVVTIANSSLSGISPNGDAGGIGVSINPVNRKRYAMTTGTQVSAFDSGAIAILDTTDTLVDVFPFGYPIDPLPTALWFAAPSEAIVFDSIGDVYMVSRGNANYYYYTRNDVIKFDGSTNSYITTFNYDNLANPIWVPFCDNGLQNTRSIVQYYDGTGFISGEKILVLYRNRGPLINTFNLILNGDFATATDWSFLPIPGPSGWAIGAGVATHTPGNAGSIYQYAGSTYPTAGINTLTFDITVNASYIDVYAGAVLVAGNINATGSYTFTFNSPAPAFNLEFRAQSAFDGSIDNVTLSNPLIPDVFGNTWTSLGNSAKLVAFDPNTGTHTDIITIPDAVANKVVAFNYNHTYNKIFFSTEGSNVLAYDKDGLKIYQQDCFNLAGGYVYSLYDIKESGLILALNTNNLTENIAVIGPVSSCDTGRVNIINEGVHTFDNDLNEWVPTLQSSTYTQLGNQFTLTATINIPTTFVTIEYSLNLTNWFNFPDITGKYSFTPAQLADGLMFTNPTDDPFWVRVNIKTEDGCTIYGEVLPEPPPFPNFEGSPLNIFRYSDVSYEDLSVGFPTSWSWTFEGGTPSTSTAENPTVTYETEGLFDTTLTVTNANGTLSKTMNNYVVVNNGGLLNFVPGAAVGYSVRLINIFHSGPCIKVRRDSDNTDTDIYFSNFDLDISSLESFCAGANGYVVVLYDQSGNGNDLTQYTSALQPQIVSSGSVILENGKPCIVFDGIDDNMQMTSSVIVSDMTTSIVANQTDTSATKFIVGSSSANYISIAGASNFIMAASSVSNVFAPSNTGNQGLFTIHRNGLPGPNNLSSAYRNGVQLTQINNLLTTELGTYSAISGASGANIFVGNMQEIIIWGAYKAAKNSVIQNVTNSYYNIY